jgi:hypothetical protein
MNVSNYSSAIVLLLMQTTILAVLPPLIFRIVHNTTGWRRFFRLALLVLPTATIVTLLLLFTLLGYAMGGNSHDNFSERIAWLNINPIQIAIFIFLLAAMAIFARHDYTTLRLCILAVGAAYFALWLGVGGFTDSNAWLIFSLAILAGLLAGVLAAFAITSRSHVPSPARTLVLWTTATGTTALIGVLVAWNLYLTSPYRYSWITRVEMDVAKTLPVLGITLVLGLLFHFAVAVPSPKPQPALSDAPA